MSRRSGMTVGELMAELRADPVWVAANDRREAELAARSAAYRLAEAPLLDALRCIGYELGSVWELVNTAKPYPSALPVLLEHLQRDYPSRIREGIARAMAVRDARFAWPVLKQLFLKETERDAQEGLAAALSAMCDIALVPQLMELAVERKYGPYRAHFLSPIIKYGGEAGVAVLESLCDDPEVAPEAKHLLKQRQKRLERARNKR